MKKSKSVSDFKEQFTARIARARHDAGYTQASMAIALGLAKEDDPAPASTYGKYETRSMMPLVEKPTGWRAGAMHAKIADSPGRIRQPS